MTITEQEREDARARADHFSNHYVRAVDLLTLLEDAASSLHSAAPLFHQIGNDNWGGDGELSVEDHADAAEAFRVAHRELWHIERGLASAPSKRLYALGRHSPRRCSSMGQPLGRQRQDHLIHAGQPAPPFADEPGLESVRQIARHLHLHLHLHLANVDHHGLGAAVAAVLPSRIVPVMAQVIDDLAFQDPAPAPAWSAAAAGHPHRLAAAPHYSPDRRASRSAARLSSSGPARQAGRSWTATPRRSDIKRLFLDHQTRR
jgi:hypothetical protein